MPPINPARLSEMQQEANALQQKGQGREALEIYRKILEIDPKIAEAHFQCGILYMKALRFDLAVAAFAKAAGLRPDEPEIWKGYCEALFRAGDAEAIRAARGILESSALPEKTRAWIRARMSGKAVKNRPGLGAVPPKAIQDVIRLLNANRPRKAVNVLTGMIGKNPGVAVLHCMLGTALLNSGKPDSKPDRAIASLRKAGQLDPGYFEGQLSLGKALFSVGEAKPAITALEAARSIDPKDVDTLGHLGRAYNHLGMRENAVKALDRALRIDPEDVSALHARAQIAEKENDFAPARRLLRKCIANGLRSSAVYVLLSRVHSSAGDTDAALEAIETAIEKQPDSAEALGVRATILQTSGQFEAADAAFRQAFEAAPANGLNYRIYSASHTFEPGDPLIARMEHVYEDETLPDQARMQLGFALSKAMEDTGRHDRVFGYLNASSRIMRAEYPYNIGVRRNEVDRIKAAFAQYSPKTHPNLSDSRYDPIFVTGMPRSGTTLVEQIISSHSTVTGIGETGRFSREAYRAILTPTGDLGIHDLGREVVNHLAGDFRSYIQGLFPESNRITDKSIQTYAVMGLVWIAMPKARVVVVRRDPKDNLFSLYKNIFPAGTHLYSYDLHDLGQYYRMFVEMIDFWRSLKPDGFHEIWYEDLIENPEEETRRLIAACDLEWQEACLNFHQNKRKVDTLSVYQVRQPIYKSSVRAWQRHERDLRPLFDSLGNLADPAR